MKNGWRTCDLGDVLARTETIDPTRNPDKEFYYMDVSSVNNKTLSIETVSKLKGSEAPSRARKLVRTNDVIFATVRPTLKRIALIPEQYDQQVCSTGYFVLQGKEFIDNRFLFYFLQTDEVFTTVEKLQKGASYPAIADSDVKGLRFSYPPVEEQRRIVAILDEAFACIDKAKANTEKNIQNARELFDSYLNNIFSNPGPDWKRRPLKELTSKIGSGATPRGGKKAYKTSGISLIRSMNVHDRRFKPDNLAFIDTKQASELSNVTLQQHDVLINITGASIARSCLCPDEYLPGRVNQHVSIVRAVSDKIDPLFLNFMLTSSEMKERLLNVGIAGGSTRQALTKTDLEDFEMGLPTSIIEQQALASKLSLCETETKEIEVSSKRKLRELGDLKKSILQRAFEGNI